MNSCIVIRGNNFGLPPLVTQRGWIWPLFVTVQPSTSERVPLCRNPSFASWGAASLPLAAGGSFCPTLSSQVNPVWDLAGKIVTPWQKQSKFPRQLPSNPILNAASFP